MKFVSHREFNRIKEIFENCGVPLLVEKHGSNREPISCVSWYFKSENESLYEKSRYFKYNTKYQLLVLAKKVMAKTLVKNIMYSSLANICFIFLVRLLFVSVIVAPLL